MVYNKEGEGSLFEAKENQSNKRNKKELKIL